MSTTAPDDSVLLNHFREIESILRNRFKAKGNGITQKTESIEDKIPVQLCAKLVYISHKRNKFLHEKGVTLSDDFKWFCLSVVEELTAHADGKALTAKPPIRDQGTTAEATHSRETKPFAFKSSRLGVTDPLGRKCPSGAELHLPDTPQISCLRELDEAIGQLDDPATEKVFQRGNVVSNWLRAFGIPTLEEALESGCSAEDARDYIRIFKDAVGLGMLDRDLIKSLEHEYANLDEDRIARELKAYYDLNPPGRGYGGRQGP